MTFSCLPHPPMKQLGWWFCIGSLLERVDLVLNVSKKKKKNANAATQNSDNSGRSGNGNFGCDSGARA